MGLGGREGRVLSHEHRLLVLGSALADRVVHIEARDVFVKWIYVYIRDRGN